MRVLVTGGAGFIGSHLCKYLIEKGHDVICMDNLSTGSVDNLNGIIRSDSFTFIDHDIIDPFTIKEKLDQIYNLACPASPAHYQANPIRTIKTNTIGVINVLGAAKKHKARILQASTSEVYGDPLEHPQKETYRGNVSCIGPRACYDEGKRIAEALFFEYYRKHKLDIKVVRIFNTHGPSMAVDDGRVVSNFIVQALKNESLTIYGNGQQTRSFCFVSDLVEGLYKMMNSENFTGPVNLGNPDEFRIIELAEKVKAMTGSSAKVLFRDLPEDDPKVRKPDISLAKEKLNWEPQVKLDEGLMRTIKYFREKLSQNKPRGV